MKIIKKQKMKLLFYADVGGSGGFQRYCKGLLSANNIPKDIEIFLIISNSFIKKLKPIDDSIHIISHDWMDHPSRIKRYLFYLWIYPKMIRKIKPDVEFYANGNLRVYLRKVKTIATCHNQLLFDLEEIGKIKEPSEREYFLKARTRFINSFNKCNGLIFLSEHSRKVVSKDLIKTKINTVISHGLDSIFTEELIRSYKIKETAKILYVSPIFHYKHQLEVVKAIKYLTDQGFGKLELNLVGGGIGFAAKELKEWVISNNMLDKVKFIDFVDSDILKESYLNADIFVFASSCETFGITLLEAMGAKLPIACSNRTGLEEILRDAGTYFDPEDIYSIQNAISQLLNNESLRKQLGEKAYQIAKEYSWQKCATQTYDFIRRFK